MQIPPYPGHIHLACGNTVTSLCVINYAYSKDESHAHWTINTLLAFGARPRPYIFITVWGLIPPV